MDTTPPSTPPRPIGRPSSYTPEIGLTICELLADGMSLRAICTDAGLPNRSTILRWLVSNEEFRRLYQLSREIGMDALCDEALSDATASMRPEDVQAERLKLDARKWFAAKVAPRRWGDRVQAEISGPNGSPVQLQAMPTMLVPREVAAGIKALLDKGEDAAGLPRSSAPDAERLRRVLASGEPLDPDLYEALHSDDGR